MCKPTLLSIEKDGNKTSFDLQLIKAKKNLSQGTLYACISLIILISAFSLLMPFTQTRRDELQCDTLCQGSMTSARSTLTLIGSALMGRLSDKKDISFLHIRSINGRILCLYIGTIATLIGFIISGSMNSITGMWIAMIPGALLQQNFSIYKALLADYHEEISQLVEEKRKTVNQKSNDEDIVDKSDDYSPYSSSSTSSANTGAARAGSVGKLGMSVGLSFMIGPLLGTTLVKSYQNAVILSSFLTILSAFWIIKMPIPRTLIASNNDDNIENDDEMKHQNKNLSSSWRNSLRNMMNVESAKTKPAMFLMIIRSSMALAFHIFNLIWTVSLKKRFDFGPSDHGKFMSYIGLVFALSQGFLAKRILAPFHTNKGRINVILACCMTLGIGRVVAFQVNDIRMVYLMFGFIVTSLGVVNTILTADTCLIAPSSEIGSVYGVLEAAQSAAGMVGPFIGGLLAKIHPVHAPLGAVVGLYVLVFVLVLFGYETLILNQGDKRKNKSDVDKKQI